MIKTYQLNVSGKVQGVWYRASAKEKALSLGLTGKIWNEQDGSVGAIVQGDLNKILEFTEWCEEGPPLANVDEVTSEEIDDEKTYPTFEIVKTK